MKNLSYALMSCGCVGCYQIGFMRLKIYMITDDNQFSWCYHVIYYMIIVFCCMFPPSAEFCTCMGYNVVLRECVGYVLGRSHLSGPTQYIGNGLSFLQLLARLAIDRRSGCYPSSINLVSHECCKHVLHRCSCYNYSMFMLMFCWDNSLKLIASNKIL